MIKTEDIQKIVKLTLISGYIKDASPLSLIVVGKAGIGKTENIKHWKDKRSMLITDLNYSGLMELLIKKNTLKHIIIPDFIKITMKKSSTKDNLISFLNSCIEDGLNQIEGYFHHKFKDRKIGLITSSTKASFTQNKPTWKNMGFTDRMIICSYSYSQKTLEEIKDYINEEKFNVNQEKIQDLKITEIKSNKLLNSVFNDKVKDSLRSLKQFQTLAKCNALNEGRNKVLKEDITEVLRLTKYLNEKYIEI